ncbi:MAG: GGDEF domain-containing protein [Eubacterium sp.]|nr:GGDEF domain-containing protein [Eubacterium sp.]
MNWRSFSFHIYVVIMLGILIVGIWLTIGYEDNEVRLTGFSEDWRVSNSRRVDLNDIPRVERGDRLVLTKDIPVGIQPGDVWNLVSHNIKFSVYLGSEPVYSYYPKENITGAGYGNHIHRISIHSAEKTVTLVCEPVYPGETGVFFKESYIGSSGDFNAFLLREYGLAFGLSLLTVIIGLLILIMHFTSFRVAGSMYNMPALGISVILLGIWTSISTMIPQMLLNDQYIMRVFDYACLAFVGYPLVLFVNSVTEKKRRIYEIVSLIVTSICTFIMLLCRVAGGVDMHDINFLNLISCGTALVLIVLIIIDDIVDHIKNSHRSVNRALYAGGFIFVCGAMGDLIIYFFNYKYVANEALLTRCAFLIFVLLIVIQGQRRMMHEHRMAGHQRFINRLLQYSYSSQSPDVIIDQMLEYLCTETYSDHAYIFEERQPGEYEKTYEYYSNGIVNYEISRDDNRSSEVIPLLKEQFQGSDTFEINDMSVFKNKNDKLYRLMKNVGVDTLVACPLERNGGVIGYFGLDNPPRSQIRELMSVIRLLGFFIVMALRQRDNQEQLVRFSYMDHLTGVRNRRSLEEMKSQMADSDIDYGMLMCDINGLKKMNDALGHEAGDRMITTVADVLKQAYGDRRVFRMGGDEFLVVREGGTKEQFEATALDIKKMISEYGYSVSVGTSFSGESEDFNGLMKIADKRMYADKEEFYKREENNRRVSG